MVLRKINRYGVLALAAGLFTVACSEDEVTPVVQPELPTTYNFENVSYSGQQARILMLDSLVRKMATANDGVTVVTASDLESIYKNSSGNLFGSSAQLYGKTYADDQTLMLDYFQMVENLSGDASNIKGERLISPEGLEPLQLVAKGLMGSVLYYQVVSENDGYLGQKLKNADNVTVTPGEGTKMQHYWDEAFGYFGAPKNYLAATPDGKAWYWAGYANKLAGLGVDVRQDLFNAFIQGRDAINRNDYVTRDAAIAVIREKWDLIAAAATLNYINSSLDDIQAGNPAALYHHWSEGKGFAEALKFNPSKKISNTDYAQLITLLRESPATTSEEDLAQYKQDLQNASLLLIEAYDFTPAQVEAL